MKKWFDGVREYKQGEVDEAQCVHLPLSICKQTGSIVACAHCNSIELKFKKFKKTNRLNSKEEERNARHRARPDQSKQVRVKLIRLP